MSVRVPEGAREFTGNALWSLFVERIQAGQFESALWLCNSNEPGERGVVIDRGAINCAVDVLGEFARGAC